MWKRGKEIEVNKASMVELKAELFRKKAEYAREKADPAERAEARVRAKKTAPVKQNRGVAERAQRDAQHVAEEARNAEKVRAKLEAKAKLYDELKRRAGDGNFEDEEQLLVDFEKKAWESEDDSETEALAKLYGSPGAGSATDDEFVEYVDDLGRTRTCLRKDLPYMREREKTMPRRSPGRSAPALDGRELDADEDGEQFPLPRQLRAAQYEEPKSTGPVHFQEVLGSEIRDLGVGYFGFSTDPLERQRQMDELNKLRSETVESRQRRAKHLQRKKDALERRLAKVRERKERRAQERQQVEGGMALPPDADEPDELPDYEDRDEDSAVASAQVADFLRQLAQDLSGSPGPGPMLPDPVGEAVVH